MIQDIVTVTQLADMNQLRFQSHSIDLFVTDPITHRVIVQDRSDLDQWQQELAPFYRRHKLELHPTLLPADQYDRADRDGYRRQQVLKLMASQLVVRDRYLVLDSKNFFWKPMSLHDWPCQEGRPVITPVNATGPRQPWLNTVAEHLGMPSFDHTYEVLTPFVMITAVARKCCEFDLDLFWNELSRPTKYWESEFVFYSWIAHNFFGRLTQEDLAGQPDLTKSDVFYITEQDIIKDKLDSQYAITTGLCAAVHRDVIVNLSQQQKILLTDWLVDLGFDRSISFASLDEITK